jgi:hypothetical protein
MSPVSTKIAVLSFTPFVRHLFLDGGVDIGYRLERENSKTCDTCDTLHYLVVLSLN